MSRRRMAVGVMMAVLVLAAGPAARADDLAKSFVRPPDSARPWVYWFWLNSNITREGITADLESMKRVGIGGVLIMEVDQGAPVGPVKFAGPEWRELFKHMCAEAARLGLEVNMNNDAGWCGSGGPWITPDLSMQKIVWTETRVQGPKKFEAPLPPPAAVANYYRDIAAFAFPTPAGEEARMADAAPKATTSAGGKGIDPAKLIDGKAETTVALPRPEPGKPQYVQIEFAQPFAARQFNLTMSGPNQNCHGALQVSDNGRTFKALREFDVPAPAPSVSLAFDEVSARFFRVLFTRPGAKMDKLTVAEVSLTLRYRIDDIQGKSALLPRQIPPRATYPVVPAQLTISRNRLVDLTARLGKDGRLAWDVPDGKWTILRMGHTTTGKDNHPAPESGRGLECDKLSKEAAEAHFAGLMGKLIADVGPLAGKTLVATHIDSWEVGSQNWTPRFREEFQRRRGYDPMPWMPVMTGRVVDSLEASERFLWDVRQTVSDLLVDNYAGHFRDLAHKHGMRLSIEAYFGVPCDEMVYGGRADEPMAEFWSWNAYGQAYSCTEMASVAHVYGKPILGAEAFTANNEEKWLGHPGGVKALGDWAFAEGINRFVFHRYALQPWKDRRPGMSMGPWGLHYERTQTWWEQSAAWHEYLSRCQYLLQQGLFVADLCYLTAEGSPRRFVPPATASKGGGASRPGYNFDGCPPEVVLTRMAVKDGRLVLPDGMSYRLLVLPDAETMTPRLLAKIKELVEAGATVVGRPPLKSPSLTDYPRCDEDVRKLVAELWGNCDGKTVKEHPCGKGRVVWGKTPEEVLAGLGVRPDFEGRGGGEALRYIHKSIKGTEVYFVASPSPQPQDTLCVFRVQGRRPELWYPDTGRIERAAVYDEAEGGVRVPIRFDPTGSVFVVFRPEAEASPDRIVSVALNGKTFLSAALPQKGTSAGTADNNRNITQTFTVTAWVNPAADTPLPQEVNSGIVDLNAHRNDVVYPPPGHEVYTEEGQAGSGLSVGKNGVCVYEHGASYFAPVLVHKTPVEGWTHVAVAYHAGVPSLYLNGQFVHKGLKGAMTVHPGVGVQHTRPVAAFQGGLHALEQSARALTQEEITRLMESTRPGTDGEATPSPCIDLVQGEGKGLSAQVWQTGTYEVKTAAGKTGRFAVSVLPAPIEIAGPWEVRFAPGGGAPERLTLDKLISWSVHSDPGVKYFSGTAVYLKTFAVPPEMLGKNRRLVLDLGKVAVMAEVKLNGQDLGILWKPPFRVDVTDAAKAGDNDLEVRVVNLWVNRMIGDEQLPEDSQRNPNGTLKEWPPWLQEGKPSPTGRTTFTSWRLWKKDDPLVESGLLGPVTLRAAERVVVQP